MPMEKKIWAGVVNNEIQFYNSNPQGSVQGLQGSRPFTVSGNGELHDESGNNLIQSTEANTGTGGSAGNVTSQSSPQEA